MSRKKKSLPPGVRYRNGRYTFRYDVIDPATGNRIQKETPSFSTPTQAYNEGIKIKAQILEGTYVDEKNMTIRQLRDAFLKHYEQTGVKENTVRKRKESLNRLVEEYGGYKAKDFSASQYRKILYMLKESGNKKKKGAGLSKESLILFHTACKMMFDWAESENIIRENRIKNIKLPIYQQTVEEIESEEEIPRYLEAAELAKLINHVKIKKDHLSQQLWRMYYVLSHSGLRVGEICCLEDKDILEVTKQISVTKTQLYRPGGVENFGRNTPKNKPSIRKVDVSANVIKVLRDQLSWRNQFKMSVRDRYNDSNYVFINCQKKPGCAMHIHTVERMMKIHLQEVGLPTSITPHSLRHTFVSLMAEAGLDLAAIQKLIGHSSGSKITERIYLHVTNKRKRAAVELLDELTKIM